MSVVLLIGMVPYLAFPQGTGDERDGSGTDPDSARVVISFQVKAGKVSKVKAIDVECHNCSHEDRKTITDEAIRVVGSMDAGGSQIKDAHYVLPIKFKLTDDPVTGAGEEAQEEILSAGRAYIGMPVEELKRVYPDAVFEEEPVFMYGVDGESLGLLVIINEEPLLFVWTMDGEETIAGITILSPEITIDGDVRVGMTVQEFFAKHPGSRLAIDSIDDGIEFAYVPGKKYRVEFLTTTDSRVGRYDSKSLDPEFIDLERSDATVDRISL